MRFVVATLLFTFAAFAGEKKLPSGEAANEDVLLQASVLDADHLQQIFSSDFNNIFVVVEVTVTPKGGKAFEFRLDDFLLRSEQTGAHSGPLTPSQIGGQGGLVINRSEPKKRGFGGGVGGLGGIMMGGGGSPGMIPQADNSRVEAKDEREQDPQLGMLKRKILAEKPIAEPTTGLLFFPLEKEKPKNLALVLTTPSGKLRFKFK